MKNLSFTVAAFLLTAGLCQAQETLTLEQAVAMALDSNRSLRSSALEVQKAQDRQLVTIGRCPPGSTNGEEPTKDP